MPSRARQGRIRVNQKWLQKSPNTVQNVFTLQINNANDCAPLNNYLKLICMEICRESFVIPETLPQLRLRL